MRNSILIISFILLCQQSFAQVTFKSPWPTGDVMNAVCAVGNNTVIAVGVNKTILKGGDTGNEWRMIENTDFRGITYRDVCFPSASTGYIVGDRSVVMKTTDGGESWAEKLYNPARNFVSVSFPSVQVGYAIGSHIMKTTDAGETWSLLPNTATYTSYKKVFFLTESTGYVLESYRLSRTTDGGASWEVMYTNSNAIYTSISCTDANTVYVGTNTGQLLRSTNGGMTWSTLFDMAGQAITAVCFTDASRGWASCKDFVIRTSDGGNSWSQLYTGFGAGGQIAFSGDGHGYMVDGCRILKTENAGTNWQLVTEGDDHSFSGTYRDMCFLNNETGFVLRAEDGGILKTIDGGLHWMSQTAMPNGNFTAIEFVNENLGIAVGYNGLIARTTDGGSNWTIVPCGTYNAILAVSFGDENIVYVAGDGMLLKSTDAGLSWINCFTIPFYTNQNYSAVHFLNATTGIICGSSAVYRTTNGGLSFSPVASFGGKSMFFLDQNLGFAAPYISGEVLKTVNGGQSWTSQNISSWVLNSVCFITPDTGFAVGDGLFRTTDGGETWLGSSIQSGHEFKKVTFTDHLTGYIINSADEVLKSTDGGNSWFYVKGGATDLMDVFFADQDHGVAIGFDHITKVTNDGGKNWKSYYSAAFYLPDALWFTSADTGFAVDYMSLLKTTDGGKNWYFLVGSYPNDMNAVYFIDGSTGFAVGDGGYMISTTNAGLSWTVIPTGATEDLYAIYFADSVTGVAGGNHGIMLRTANRGQNWTPLSGSFNTRITRMQFVDGQTGYASGNGDDPTVTMLLKTTDKGQNWTKIKEYSDWYIYQDFFFVDSITGYFVFGSPFDKAVFKTGDGGLTMKTLFPGSDFDDDRCRAVCFNQYDNGYVVGLENTILRIGEEGFNTAVQEPAIASTSGRFSIYPNPAHNYITICRNETTMGTVARIKIFNLQGREVMGEILMKTPQKLLDLSRLAKGVYVVIISSGENYERKKLILQ